MLLPITQKKQGKRKKHRSNSQFSSFYCGKISERQIVRETAIES